MPASTLRKNALGVRADTKGQVSLTPHTHPNLTKTSHTYSPIHHHHHKNHSQRSHRWASWARGPRSSSRPRTPRKWRKPWGASAPQLVESGSSSQFWLAPETGPAVACGYALRSSTQAVQLAMRGRSATPQRVGQRLRSRTLLTPRYLCPRDREDAHHAGQGASAGAQVHMHAPGSWPCTLVDIPPPRPYHTEELEPPSINIIHSFPPCVPVRTVTDHHMPYVRGRGLHWLARSWRQS